MANLKPFYLLLVVAVSGFSPITAASGIDLSNYRWKHRLLFIFAPSATDATFLALDKRLSQASPEVEDRDVIVFRVFENSASRVADKLLPPEDAEALRRRFATETGRFTVVLVGKDGGVKLVGDRDVDLQSIFRRIDSMPMRQQEMRNDQSKR